MDLTVLGRTNVEVSRMGLGCGGHSRLGLSKGLGEGHAENLVREALDLGITFFDTAESYRTESAVGRGLKGHRHKAFISTKAGIDWQDERCTRAKMRQRVEACLERLQTDWIDLFNLHGVTIDEYSYGRDELYPELLDLQSEGKIRFIGITEQFGADTSHKMLQVALADDLWDVVMIGFNLINQSARSAVLTVTQEKHVGTQCMFAVRRALGQPMVLRDLFEKLVETGQVDAADFDSADPLGFLGNIQDAAYRFCRWEPGINVVLSGTSSVEHLRENALSLNRPALPSADIERLQSLFARVDSVSGN